MIVYQTSYFAGKPTLHFIIYLRRFFEPVFCVDTKKLYKFYTIVTVNKEKQLIIAEATESRDEYNIALVKHSSLSRHSLRLFISLKGLSDSIDMLTTSINNPVALRPTKKGFIIMFNRQAEPGLEPPLTPILVKRFKVKKSKKFRNRIGLTRVKKLVQHYKYASHIGGKLLILNNNPCFYRAPYTDIVSTSHNFTYLKLEKTFLESIGITDRLLAYDVIVDLNKNVYVRLYTYEELR